MANNGAGTDDETWEDPSDVYEILSETGGSEPEDSGEHDSDDMESSVPGDVEHSRGERPGRAVGRASGQSVERGAVRGPVNDLRGSSTQTPPSHYQMARQMQPRGRRDPGRNQSPTLPKQFRPVKLVKPPSKRAFVKPPRFEGKDSCLESHLVQFEIAAKHNQWDDQEKADFLKCSLSGEASHMLRDLDDKATYDDVVSKLRQRYGSLEQIESYRMELKHRKRQPGETLSHLLQDIRRLFLLAYPGPQNYMTLITARDAFIDALDDRDLMIKVMEREPSSLDQAFKVAECLELYQKIPGGREVELKTKPASKVRGTTSESDPLLQSIVETQKLMQRQLSVLSESIKKDRPMETKVNDPVKVTSGKSKGVCHECHQPGHYRMQCPEWQKKKTTEASAGAVSRSIRSSSSTRRRNGRYRTPSFSVQPVRNRPNRRPAKVINSSPVLPASSDTNDEMRPTAPDKAPLPRPECPVDDKLLKETKESGDVRSNQSWNMEEWIDFVRKYPPPPMMPPVPPRQSAWVPSMQPDRVPPVQPDRVPPSATRPGCRQCNLTGCRQCNPTGCRQCNLTGCRQCNPTGCRQCNLTGCRRCNPITGFHGRNLGCRQRNPSNQVKEH